MDFLRCVVERITYTNEESGYTVLKVRAKGYNVLVTAVGSMGAVNVGAVLSMKGEWKADGKYGRQFSVREYEETLPATVFGIEKYLGSGLIKGVGPKFAGRIVKTFGADTLTIIEETPDRLTDVPGIGKKRVRPHRPGQPVEPESGRSSIKIFYRNGSSIIEPDKEPRQPPHLILDPRHHPPRRNHDRLIETFHFPLSTFH